MNTAPSQANANELAEQRTSLGTLRSHLANERTHLAYLRTCVSLIGFGITLNRFSEFLQQHKTLAVGAPSLLLRNTSNVGAGMVLLGLMLGVWALYRYWHVKHDIEAAVFRPMDRAVFMITLLFLMLGGVTAAWLIFQ